MIFFISEGRFGNQIFQYMFLKSIQESNEKIIVFGFDELKQVFDVDDFIDINSKNRYIRYLVYQIIKPFLNLLANKKVITSISVNNERVLDKYRRETTNYNVEEGLIKKIKFLKLGFFQSEKFFKKELTKKLVIKHKFVDEAKEFLKPYKDKYKIFVHIRRGDYRNYKVYGKDTLLPMSYFHNQIKWFLENKRETVFIFLSDEPDFIEDEFAYLNDKVISNNNYKVDFAIMTLCKGAILSPSSFGWWGSYLMKERGIVVAPKYWLGFKSKIEYHLSPSTNFMKEVEV